MLASSLVSRLTPHLSERVRVVRDTTIRGSIEQRTAWAEYGEPCVSDFIHVGGQS